MVVCLERGATMVQLMPLPPNHLLLQPSREWFIPLALAYPGCPGKRPLNGCVCVCVCVDSAFSALTLLFGQQEEQGIWPVKTAQ